MLCISCYREKLYSTNCSNIPLKKNMKISILRDLYSTFQEYLYPENNPTYYPNKETNVTEVVQTWWNLFISKNLLKLECNNSYSGSTIARINNMPGASYTERYNELGNPDLILYSE